MVEARVKQRWLSTFEVVAFKHCYYKCIIDDKAIAGDDDSLNQANPW
ncbi:hypothetical protein [Abyssogena phaseoliformis symbiont]|nr:hypothetical protein [Abyssogena phaseoliformis symbiont]MBW5289105.1 hypothetical protein [Candidatus Ruthia sp. Apha_13_S6]